MRPRRFTGAEIGAEYVDVEDAAHPFGGHVGEFAGRRHDSGIDDDTVQRAQFALGGVEHRDHLGLGGNVALHDGGAAARGAHRLGRVLGGLRCCRHS